MTGNVLFHITHMHNWKSKPGCKPQIHRWKGWRSVILCYPTAGLIKRPKQTCWLTDNTIPLIMCIWIPFSLWIYIVQLVTQISWRKALKNVSLYYIICTTESNSNRSNWSLHHTQSLTALKPRTLESNITKNNHLHKCLLFCTSHTKSLNWQFSCRHI